MLEDNKKNIQGSIKDRVMEHIRKKKIKMKSPFIFVAEKLGLESALAAVIIIGAFLISILLYFLKKTGILKFLSLGMPGFKIFLLTLPYDYIILFIASIILAIYFANKIEFFCGKCSRTNVFAVYFFIGTLLLGLFFAYMGVGDFFKGWSKKNIPKNNAISGKIKNFSEKEVLVEDENGNIITVFIETPNAVNKNNYKEGKFLRAIGNRDKNNDSLFNAQIIRCCDDN